MKPKTPEQMEQLSTYFTNPGGRVNVVKYGIDPTDIAAALSRYSRDQRTIEDILLEEIKPGTKKSEGFFDKVFVEYGDDSVSEMCPVVVSFSGVSQIAAKNIEDARANLSAIEKSSRYVTFAKLDDLGKYGYVREPTIMSSVYSGVFEKLCDYQFSAHVKSFNAVHDLVIQKNPKKENESDIAFSQSRRAKALDITRDLLPAAAKTNVGIVTNMRTAENLIFKLFSAGYQEASEIGEELHAELSKLAPPFMKRVKNEHGKAQVAYLNDRSEKIRALASQLLGGYEPISAPEVTLVKFSSLEDQVVSRILYEGSNLPLAQIRDKAMLMKDSEKKMVIDAYLGNRDNRRQKPGRAFEDYEFVFDIKGKFAIYRDLQRHRMQSQMRQLLTTELGYSIPSEVKEVGLEGEWRDVMSISDEVFRQIREDYPVEAQMVVPFGCNLRWYMAPNTRELWWKAELRTTPQGHPDYRRVVNTMWDLVKREHPMLFDSKIVEKNRRDCEGLSLERQASEIRKEEKLQKISRDK